MPGTSVTPALMLAIMSRWGATSLRTFMRARFMSKSSASWASVGALRMSSSSASIRSSKSDRYGKKPSTRELMMRYTMTIWGDAPWLAGWRSSPSRTDRQGRAVPPVHRDHVAIVPEAVHLGDALVLGIGAAGHQEHEVVVVVDPGTLREALRRLHGQRVEAEVDAQELRHLAVRGDVLQVEPEEPAARQRGEHVLRRRRLVAALLAQRPLQHAPSFTSRAGPGWMMSRGSSGADSQAKRAGSNADGSGASPPGSGVPVMSWARRPGRVGPLQQTVGAVAGGDQDVAPSRHRPTRARSSAEVGRSPTRVSR